MGTRCLVACSLVVKPLSMAKISLRVKVPTIVSVEVDHRPSGSRKTPPLRMEELCRARPTYIGGKRIQLAVLWRDRDARSGIIVRCRRNERYETSRKGSNSWNRMWI